LGARASGQQAVCAAEKHQEFAPSHRPLRSAEDYYIAPVLSGSRITSRDRSANALAPPQCLTWENVPENQGVRPIFQIPIFTTTFASSSPLTPARQFLCGVISGVAQFRDRRDVRRPSALRSVRVLRSNGCNVGAIMECVRRSRVVVADLFWRTIPSASLPSLPSNTCNELIEAYTTGRWAVRSIPRDETASSLRRVVTETSLGKPRNTVLRQVDAIEGERSFATNGDRVCRHFLARTSRVHARME
jgi:hypothetical protein